MIIPVFFQPSIKFWHSHFTWALIAAPKPYMGRNFGTRMTNAHMALGHFYFTHMSYSFSSYFRFT